MSQAFYAGYGAMQPSFVGYVQDGKIFCSDAQGQQVIGVTTKTHDELKADYDSVFKRCEEYYKRLVKLGEITPELTGEALIKAQAEELARAASLINQMSKNQEHLLSVIRDMTDSGQNPEEEEHGYSADTAEISSGHLSPVAGLDNGIEQGARPVQKHKTRSAKGNSRKTTAA